MNWQDIIYGFILGLIFGIIVSAGFLKNSYHGDLCQERLFHAETAADSLTIIQVDNFCLKVTEQE